MNVCWLSGGVSSAVCALLAAKTTLDLRCIFIEISDHHPDTERFLFDLAMFLPAPVERIQSATYTSVEQACRARAFLNGPHGAPCTELLKRRPRKDWERKNPGNHTYFWGFDASPKEVTRAARIQDSMPKYDHRFPLIEEGLTKEMAHGYLASLKIKRPAMYDEGFPNNNCIGCVKGGMGYWRKIRELYPYVFAKRAELEKLIGATFINGLSLENIGERGRDLSPIVEDCGVFCELPDFTV